MSQKYFTLIIPFSHTNDQVLLGLKKRGTGTGLWNGFGGKLEKGESIDECAVRELREESGVAAVDMTYVGVLYMNCTDGVGDTMIFVYKCKCGGTIVESDEMRPKWFGVDGIPYSEMYEEAVLWWPVLLDNEDPRFVASFMFDGDDLISHEIKRGDKDNAEVSNLLADAQSEATTAAAATDAG